MDIDAILVNYRRPDNIKPIVAALRAQTVPVQITLINAGLDELDVKVDTYVRLRENFGSWNRYATALLTRAEFVYFHDDDMLPGPGVIENFLRFTQLRFGVLGQVGRCWTDYYRGADVIADRDPLPVTHVVRGYFTRTTNLAHLLHWRRDAPFESDDIALCRSMFAQAGLSSYVVPLRNEADKMNLTELPAPHGLCDNPHWSQIRADAVDWARNKESGW